MTAARLSLGALVCFSMASAAAPATKPGVDYTAMPLAFEPNRGQTYKATLFSAHSSGFSVQLDATGARFQFPSKNPKERPASVRMGLLNANPKAEVVGEAQLGGKANYFPTGDPKSWIANLPTYGRVHYRGVYPGIDAAFYGSAQRLEYDFLLDPQADPARIRMDLGTAQHISINEAGDLVVGGANGELKFFKPVAYQMAADGKTRDSVTAQYRLEASAEGNEIVSFALGAYDKRRALVIDPVVGALSYSQVLSNNLVDAVTVDAAGNSYVTGPSWPVTNNTAFYVTKFDPNGNVLYTSSFGYYGYYIQSLAIALDSSGKAYVSGTLYTGIATVPTTTNAYQQSPNGTSSSSWQGFLAIVSADGSSVPYCTYLSSADNYNVQLQSVAVDAAGKVYLAGNTTSATFPTTAGAYQTANTGGSLTGFVSKLDPSQSGASGLVYSTLLGSTTTSGTGINQVAVDSGGNAYLAVAGTAGYPVTAGAFQYNGYYAGSGGAYVTKLNPTGTALVYSAYLGYGGTNSLSLEGQANPSVYATGPVKYYDFPTTTGAYQTTYAGGFAVKLNSAGSAETYSTFLSGPDGNATPVSIAVPAGCQSSCNAFIGGFTSGGSLPAINAIQSSPSSNDNSAFMVELNATGSNALFSSYLSGVASYGLLGYANPNYGGQSYSYTPAIAVDSSSNIYLVGNMYTAAYPSNDFPVTTGTGEPSYYSPYFAFLAKISTTSATGLMLSQPTAVAFANQGVGLGTSVYGGTQTVRVSNYGGTALTLQPIQVAPASLFSESDNCNGAIPAGGFCTITLNFTPNSAGARAGTVTVTSNASNSPFVIPITGTGVDQPYILTAQSALTFANQIVGTTSAPQSFSFTNTGTVSATVTVATLDGTPTATNFPVLSNCPAQLAAGASCGGTVTFTPAWDGLLIDSLVITVTPPTGYNYNGTPGYGTYSIPLSGTGILSGVTPSIAISEDSLQFPSQIVSSTSSSQTVYITNNGTEPITVQSLTASGDFQIVNNYCGVLPAQLNPQQSCYVNIAFSPTAPLNRTGNLAVATSASSNPQLVPLSGIGVASSENFQIYPSTALSFVNTPVGSSSGYQTIYLQNTGSTTVGINRVLITGDFALINNTEGNYYGGLCNSLIGAPIDGVGTTTGVTYIYPQNSCYFSVVFSPTATGSRNGTLTIYDTAPGSPHVINLSGTGITQAGTLTVSPDSLNFGPQVQGADSGVQYIYFQDDGYPPATISGYSFAGAAAGDYSVYSQYCFSNLPYTISEGQTNCYLAIQFTPSATGTRGATLTVNSSAGNQTVSLTGSGFAGSTSAVTVPTTTGTATANFGPTVAGQSSAANVFLANTGTGPLTSLSNYNYSSITISGPNAADFTFYNYYYYNQYCANYYPENISIASYCQLPITFTPTGTGTETATLSFVNSFGTQTVALSGVVVAATPAIAVAPAYLSFAPQLQGAISSGSYYVTLTNNGTTSLVLGNATVTANFLIQKSNDTCSGQTIAAAGACSVYVQFAPTASGYVSGTLTFNGSTGKALSGVSTIPLSGYAFVPSNSAYLDPSVINFTALQALHIAALAQTVTLYNTSNAPLTVGSVTNTDTDFSFSSDNCSGGTVAAGGSCSVTVYFMPSVAGARAGSINFPVTYANNATATLTAALSGTGTALVDGVVLTPPNASFIDQAVGTTSPQYSTVYLNNNGNQPFTVGTLTNSNSTEFTFTDSCSGQSVTVGGSCSINVYFTPSAAGPRTGNISFPVTFADNTKATPTLPLTGNGVTSTEVLTISPASIEFPTEIQTNTSSYQTITITNTGNAPVTFGTDSISTSEFGISSDGCTGGTLQPSSDLRSYCNINVTFTPGASSTGNRTAVLTIADNSVAGGHSVALSGLAIPASQQIVVSQSTLAFGNQPAGSASSYQNIWLTNQSDSSVTINSITLAGTNAAAFTLINSSDSGYSAPDIGYVYSCAYYVNYYNTNYNEGYALGARTSCYIPVQFNPLAGSTGNLIASITETDSATPGTHTINLTGSAVVAGPAAAFSPSTASFATQSVGTTSAAQNFSVTNTGTANLTLTGVVSTNTTEFPISSDGCSGSVLTPGQHCIVAVVFAPTLGGTRTGSLKVTDNASGTPQVLSLSGTGLGIPATSFNPTSLTFGNTNIGATAASQTVTLSNPGTDTLAISSITISGVHASDFALANNTCTAKLAPTASCVLTVSFTPAASGNRGASITVVDNATNLAGSTQTIPLTGVGLAVSTASVSPASLAFPSTNVGSSATPLTVTVSNSGTGSLTISSIALGGTNSGDFSETNTCGATLVAGTNCSISVTFTPKGGSSRTATLTITDNANNTPGSTQVVQLSGTGTGTPAASLSVASVTFPSQAVGSASGAQSVTLTNTGNGTLTITSIVFAGTNSGDFSQTNTCGTSLAASANCSIAITFKPSASGSRTATLTVTDNAGNVGGTTQTATIAGTGAGVPAAATSPASLTFSNQAVGTTSNSQTVVLSNSGSAALTIASIAVGGTNAGDFAATNNCNGSVAAGGACNIVVTFTPASTGARSATLTISDNAGNASASQTVALSGTGGGAPSALLSSASLTFGNQNVSTTSAVQNITLNNGGNAALTLSSITIGGTNAADFATTNNCNGSVAANGSCSIAVTFSPSAAGSRTATLTITDNAGNVSPSTQTVTLTGTGVATPAAGLAPSSASFSNQNVGTSSFAQTLTLTNSGSGPLSISNIATTGTNPGDFTTTNNCGGSVALGTSCSIAVVFSPTAVGSRSATLTVTDNAGGTAGTTQTTSLSGYGIGVAAAVPSPASYFFGNQNVSVASAAQIITLSNSGTGALTVSGVSLSGTNAADFAATNTCTSAQVAAGSTCSISVTFTPGAPGIRSATLVITDNAGNSAGATQTVSLGGTGVGVPSAAASPNTLTFATTTLGSSATAQTVTVTNSGTGPLTVSQVVVGGTNPADFSQTNTCSTPVAVNGTCTVSVAFTPSAAGARTANLHVIDNSGNVASTQSVVLNGTGQGAAAPNGAVSPASLAFGNQNVGTSSATQTVTLSNSGSVALSIASIALGGSNAGDFSSTTTCGASLAASGSCNILVTFTPTAGGARSASLTITDNAGNTAGSTQAVAITGTGVTVSGAVLSVATVSFGNQNVDAESAAQTVTLSNSGSAALTISSIALGGTNPGDFSAANNCGTSLAAGASCSIALTFTPSASGARSATLTVTDNAGGRTGSTQTAALSGTGVATPAAALAPAAGLTFASQNVGSSSTPQTVTLTNSGSAALSISSFGISGGNSGDFSSSNNCGGTLALGASCSIAVTFSPTAAGNRTSTLVVTDNAGGTAGVTQSLSLAGTAVGVAAASVTPAALGYGNQNVGVIGAAQIITVTNNGSATLTVSGVSISGTNPGDFGATNACTSVAAGANCSISVTFTPGAPGARSATLTIKDNAGNIAGSTQTVGLTGTGVGVPSATANPVSLTFATTPLNTVSAAQTVTLSNSGTGPLVISSIVFGGVNSSEFNQTNNCGTSLEVNSSCTVSVTFTPAASGTRTANLQILDNSGSVGATQTVALSGTGAAAPTAIVSPGALSFGNQNVGIATAAQTIVVTNAGTSALTVSGVGLSGTNATDFTLANGCTSVAAGANCSISVTFTPGAIGARSATLTITDNSNAVTGATQAVSLAGTGVNVPTAVVTPTVIGFGSQNLNTASNALNITVTNSGKAALTIASVALNGGNATDFADTNNCGASVAIGASCSITVTFTPSATGARSTTLTITDNSNNVAGSTQTVALSGTGVAVPIAVVTPGTLTFNNQLVGSSSAAQTVTVSNSGTAALSVSSVALSGANPTDFTANNNCGAVAAGGNCAISVTFSPAAIGGRNATLTITDNSGNSLNATQTVSLSGIAIEAPTVASVSPSSGTATTQTFSAVYSDPNGPAGLSAAYILFNTAVSSANACYVEYYPASNLLYLKNDAGTALSAGVTPGSSATVSNSQCTLSGTGSSYSTSGNSATMNVALTFSSAFAASAKNIYLYASEKNGTNSGWVQKGSWFISPPTVVSVTPSSGTGASQTFTAVYSDPNGAANISAAYVLFNTAISSANACYLQYIPSSNLLYLKNDAGTGLTAGIAPGSSGTISNSQCTVSGTGSSYVTLANSATLKVAITFTGTTSENIYLYAADKNATNSGWVQKGGWTP